MGDGTPAVRPAARPPRLGRADGRRRGAGRAGPRARGGGAGATRAMPCTPPCAGWSGWPATSASAVPPCSSSTTSTGLTPRRCAGWRCWPGPWTSCRSACSARCARASRPRRPSCWPSCWPARPSRRCARGRSGPRRYETLVRGRLPAATAGFAQACHAVTGGNPFLLGALLTQFAADRDAPDDEAAARLGTFGSEQVARVIELQLARLPDGAGAAGPRRGRPRPRRAAAPCRRAGPARAARRGPRRGRAADRRAARGRAGPDARAPADRGNAVREPARRRAGASGTPRPPRCSRRERADPERVGLHLLRTEPAREATTVATLREAAGAGQRARRSAERGGVPAPRAAEPPPDPAEDADVRLELGLALARVHATRRLRPAARGGRRRDYAPAARHDRPGWRPCARPDRAFRRGRRAVPSGARASRRVPRGAARAARGRAGTPTAWCTRRRSRRRAAMRASARPDRRRSSCGGYPRRPWAA